jgi:hypothetical protein
MSEFFEGNERLWKAVILQAFADITSPSLDPALVQESRNWLTKPSRNFDDVCLWANIDPAQVRKSAIEIVAKNDVSPKQLHTYGNTKTFTYQGQELTIRELVSLSGVSKATLYNRFALGWTVEQAIVKRGTKPTVVKEPKIMRREKQYIYEGQSRTITQWATLKGLTYLCLYKRLRDDWTVEEALNTPSRAKNNSRPQTNNIIREQTNDTPGVGQDLPETPWDRRGCNAHNIPEIEFSKIKELTE